MTRPQAAPHTGGWQTATVQAVRRETANAKTFRLRLSEPRPHWPGQHYVVRLTAPDGYRAQRSYSVATGPGDGHIELTVELLPGGEVSGFLNEVVETGDEIEVRGPIGGYFAWDGRQPILGIAGGSGLVPLMSMLRRARTSGEPDAVRLIVSARSPEALYYRDELAGPEVSIVYTRRVPPGWARPPGRMTLDDVAPLVGDDRGLYVCGSPVFCDSATDLLARAGVGADRIKVERFGPSG